MNNKLTSITAVRVFVLMLMACVLGGCSQQPETIRLKKSIGIMTAGEVYSEIIPEGQRVPHTFSDAFGNADDNQQAMEITLAQKDPRGVEKICVVVIDNLPPNTAGTLNVVITAKVDRDKNLTLKATVSESGYIKEYGPFPVE